MIKLTKSKEAPAVLTSDDAKNSMTTIKANAENGNLKATDFESKIFNGDGVKSLLKKDQNDKCAYCEVTLAGDYGVVEHYRPKTKWKDIKGNEGLGYYWLAYDWDNLLCSCDICNNAANKGNLFPLSNPNKRGDTNEEQPLLINPYKEDPGDSIEFHEHIAVHKNKKGEVTIEVFDLNGKKKDKKGEPRRRDLVECRKNIWGQAKFTFNLLVEKGLDRQQALNVVRQLYGKDTSQFAGMVRCQKMW